jgi:MYXO-CTERM domain-containing protein
MPHHPISRFAARWAASALFVTTSASAHIELLEPTARYPRSGNKSCPCGEGDSNRRCDVPAEESSDPNRSTAEKVTRYEVGSTLTVRFTEYIGHSGRFRVAFDADGADLSDFNDHVLMDVPDPSDGRGDREIVVTLPDAPCENCTLQLIQAMHGDTENAVLDPAPLSTYYTCADIELVPKGTLTGADAGATGSADPAESGGGCSVAGGQSTRNWPAFGALSLAFVLAWRRRRRG